MPRVFIGKPEVAARLGLSVPTFTRRREALERVGFPPPLPWLLRPLRWRAEAVDAWIAEMAEAGTLDRAAPARSGEAAALRHARRGAA